MESSNIHHKRNKGKEMQQEYPGVSRCQPSALQRTRLVVCHEIAQSATLKSLQGTASTGEANQTVIIWTQLRSIEDGDRSKQPNSEPPRTTPEALLFFFPILAKEVRYRIAALQQRVYKEVWTCYNVCFETFILLLTKLHDLHAWPIRSWNFLWMLFLLSLDSWVDLLGLPVLFIGR